LTNANRNADRILRAIRGDEKITRLIRKYLSNELTDEDADRLRVMLKNVLQQLPAFGFIALPDKYLTLPLLFRVLPGQLTADSG
jgi:uncharacterized protein YpbB